MQWHLGQSGVHLTGCEKMPQAPVWGKAAWWNYSSLRKHHPFLLNLPVLQLSSLQKEVNILRTHILTLVNIPN